MVKKLIGSIGLAVALLAVSATPAEAYDVVEGDTLSRIAVAHDLTLRELSYLNPQITDLNLIFVGDVLETDYGCRTALEDEIPQSLPPPMELTTTEAQLLAQLVYAEARGESYAGKVAVAEVVLNRVESTQFPDSIEAVIYQPKQFTPARSGSIHNTPDADSVRAVQEALAGTNNTQGALYFYNASTASSRWLDGLPTLTVIGNHTFK